MAAAKTAAWHGRLHHNALTTREAPHGGAFCKRGKKCPWSWHPKSPPTPKVLLYSVPAATLANPSPKSKPPAAQPNPTTPSPKSKPPAARNPTTAPPTPKSNGHNSPKSHHPWLTRSPYHPQTELRHKNGTGLQLWGILTLQGHLTSCADFRNPNSGPTLQQSSTQHHGRQVPLKRLGRVCGLKSPKKPKTKHWESELFVGTGRMPQYLRNIRVHELLLFKRPAHFHVTSRVKTASKLWHSLLSFPWSGLVQLS